MVDNLKLTCIAVIISVGLTACGGGDNDSSPISEVMSVGTPLNTPTGVAVDPLGNIYVADSGNNVIRKISPTGVATTLAGSGVAGFVDGAGASASFNAPIGVAIDSVGNVYVGDADNNAIRKISPAGVVTTYAGGSAHGSADGTGAAAKFEHPMGVAVDTVGNVYVGDAGNNAVRKISPVGTVTTLAGGRATGFTNGTGMAASFDYPTSVAVDSVGNVYVGDTGNNAIRKISPSGVVTALAGGSAVGFADGIGTAASFNNPTGVAVDAVGNVYVGDVNNNRVRKISPTGVVTTLASTDDAALHGGPTGVAVDTKGSVYVADSGNNKILKITQKP